jgi:hypothetical protein
VIPWRFERSKGPEPLRSGPSWVCDEPGFVGSTGDAARAGN